jgi:hypothetical protein
MALNCAKASASSKERHDHAYSRCVRKRKQYAPGDVTDLGDQREYDKRLSHKPE